MYFYFNYKNPGHGLNIKGGKAIFYVSKKTINTNDNENNETVTTESYSISISSRMFSKYFIVFV